MCRPKRQCGCGDGGNVLGVGSVGDREVILRRGGGEEEGRVASVGDGEGGFKSVFDFVIPV